MTAHHISGASPIFVGRTNDPGLISTQDRDGVQVTPIRMIDYGAPVAPDADGIALTQSAAGAANLTLNGAAVTSGVATLATPRNVTITSVGNDAGITFTVTGTDQYGDPLVEQITGPNATLAAGKKAFKTVTKIATSGASAGNVTAGWADVIGLPYRAKVREQVMQIWFNGSSDAATVVLADTNTATATTGDVRGTVDPSTATDGAKRLVVYLAVPDHGVRSEILGVTQYGG